MQRVPPTERRGRVHTSTVTVAVIDYHDNQKNIINPRDLEISWFSGTGCGGQHRNKHANSCRLRHIPTGFTTTSQTRSRVNSYSNALLALQVLIENQHAESQNNKHNHKRKIQIGSGQRGDKIRTIRFQDDAVQDHRTGKSLTAREFMQGKMNLLWS
jgi:peptide chain release factor 1